MDNGASSYRRFLEGDESGFVEIVREYRDGLILYIDSFVGSISAAEDIAEDVFVKLGIKKPRFSERSSFKTWLYAIGRRLALDWLRKQKRRGEIVPIDSCAELADKQQLEADHIRDERNRAVRSAMKRLRPEYEQVLWLIYFEEFSCKEAAEVMKKSVHSVEMLVSRARQALKEQLSKEGHDHENI
ncbi:MAG: RNA polymerase sigma factor [Ruminococcus sp.]|nr:RNA polymerase sigma factor [Ruminococcus sp.]